MKVIIPNLTYYLPIFLLKLSLSEKEALTEILSMITPEILFDNNESKYQLSIPRSITYINYTYIHGTNSFCLNMPMANIEITKTNINGIV